MWECRDTRLRGAVARDATRAHGAVVDDQRGARGWPLADAAKACVVVTDDRAVITRGRDSFTLSFPSNGASKSQTREVVKSESAKITIAQ